jgi:DNA (cytosine-5)-methyltransferase 1
MNGLDLFSGIGGLALALSEWVKPVLYCERDRYAQAVLLSRMSSADIHRAPIWDDVCTLRLPERPNIDIVYGGFPCQDISAAGAGAGLAGERSGLYFELERIVRETKPAFVFLENVPAIRTRGLGRVVWGLSELGYDCRWTVVSAAEVGAWHLRKRWFLLAHASGKQLRDESGRFGGADRQNPAVTRDDGAQKSLANAAGEQERKQSDKTMPSTGGGKTRQDLGGRDWWDSEPDVARVVYELPHSLDRHIGIARRTCLGNSVVPLQAREAFKRLAGLT